MSLTTVDFLVRTNEDWRDSLVITADDGEGADPVDLTGSDFMAQIRASQDSLHMLLEANLINGKLVVADAVNGVLSWNINVDEMSLIPPGQYVYDLVWVTAGGVVDTIVAGSLTVQRGITRE